MYYTLTRVYFVYVYVCIYIYIYSKTPLQEHMFCTRNVLN